MIAKRLTASFRSYTRRSPPLSAPSKATQTLADLSAEYSDALDGLVDTLGPILVAIAVAGLLQAFPALAALSTAIGLAGAAAAIFVIIQFWERADSIFAAVMGVFRLPDTASFESESRPGWAPIGTSDPNIQDITIDWILDPSAY